MSLTRQIITTEVIRLRVLDCAGVVYRSASQMMVIA